MHDRIREPQVYDLFEWNEHHPGGDFFLVHAGDDVTEEFELVKHSQAARDHMKHFVVGKLVQGGGSEKSKL